MNVTLLIIRN